MTVLEALEVAGRSDNSGMPAFRVFLACGFTPLDLKAFVAAHARVRLGGRFVAVETGLYGDLVGSIEHLQDRESPPLDLVLVALEWSDLDPRLGYRSSGSWEPEKLQDLLPSVESSGERLLRALKLLEVPAVLSLPTLPLPPAFWDPPEAAASLQLRLFAAVAHLGAEASQHIQIVNPRSIDLASPLPQRLDVRSELETGFPYQRPHAEALARFLCSVALPEPRKRGLITDLDGTVWDGVLGEDGVHGVTWDLEHHTSIHALYQKTLASLAASGVLVAIASKNDPALGAAAFERPQSAPAVASRPARRGMGDGAA